jgi:hypothetical protein
MAQERQVRRVLPCYTHQSYKNQEAARPPQHSEALRDKLGLQEHLSGDRIP